MKYLFFSLLLLFFSNFAFAQDNFTAGSVCGFRKPAKFAAITNSNNNNGSVASVGEYVKRIKSSITWRANFSILKKTGCENAFATVLEGKRVIIYDDLLFKMIDTETSSSWSSISILAHEIGHHYYNHILVGGSKPATELEADRFSGYVMYRLGASLLQAQAALAMISPEEGSDTHPGKADRMQAIKEGWEKANKSQPRKLKTKN